MQRNLAMILILTLSSLLTTGCWSRVELNNLAIVVGLGIDKVDDQFLVTAQVVNPGQIAAKNGGSPASPVTTYQQSGETIYSAIRKVTTIAPRKLYAAHLRVLVIGEELAKAGIGKALDLLSRDQELRTDFYIVVAKDTTAANILKILTTLEKIPANKLFSSLETSEKVWAPTIAVTLDELINELVSKGIHPNLTGIQLIGDMKEGKRIENIEEAEAATTLQYKGIAVFNEDKLIGWLNDKQSKGFNYTQGNVKSTIANLSCEKSGKVGVELIRTEAKIKTKMQNKLPVGEIIIRTEGNVGEVDCKGIDLTKTETIYNLEKKVEKDIESKIKMAITSAQKEFKVDFFGFGEALHRSNPDYWKKVKNDWDQTFINMPIEIHVDSKIRRTGTIGNSFLEKMDVE